MGNGPTTNGRSPDEWEAGDLIDKLKVIEDSEDKDNALLARANVFVLRRWGNIMKRLDKLPDEITEKVTASIKVNNHKGMKFKLPNGASIEDVRIADAIRILAFLALIYIILERHGLIPWIQ
jgi:hypothetical protein